MDKKNLALKIGAVYLLINIIISGVILPLPVDFCDSIFRVVRNSTIISKGINYRKASQVSVGASPTDVHYTIFDPSKGKIQMVLHVQEEITDSKYITHTFDFEHGIVWMEDTETGKVLKGDNEVFGARILPQEHIKRFEEKTGEEVVTLTGAGNIGWNDWFVGYVNGELIASVEEKEKLAERFYSSLVVFKNGTVKILDLKYEIDKDKVKIIDAQNNEPITEEILYATFGQRLMRTDEKGTKAVELPKIYDQFDDIRHVLKLPIVIPVEGYRGGGLYLGFGQLYKDDKRLVQKALNNEPIELSLTVDYEDMELIRTQAESLKNALLEKGYEEKEFPEKVKDFGQFYISHERIKIKLKPKTLRDALGKEKKKDSKMVEMGYKDVGKINQIKEKGEYAIHGDTLTIKLLDGVYPHHIEAITESGKVVSVVVTGSSGWLGCTIPGITNWLLTAPEFKDDPIVNAVLIDNGNDHMMKVGNRWVVDPRGGTRGGRIQSVIILVK